METNALSVLCLNCGGDEALSLLVDGVTACPWCGLGFDDTGTGARGPIWLPVFLVPCTSTSDIVTVGENSKSNNN